MPAGREASARATRSGLAETTTTLACSRTAAFAVAKPKPDVPPRTTTRFSLKLISNSELSIADLCKPPEIRQYIGDAPQQ